METPQELRNQVDANVYIGRAIAMMKEVWRKEWLVADYNGIVSLLQYAKESHEAVVIDNMAHEYNQAEALEHAAEFERQIREDEREQIKKVQDLVVQKMDRVIKCLATELPEPVWNDVNNQWKSFIKLFGYEY